MSIQTARIPQVFGAFDADVAGLPAELVAAREAVRRLDAALANLGPPPQLPDVRSRELAQTVAEQARTGEVSLELDELERLEHDGRGHARASSVLRQAKDLAAQHLAVLVEDRSDEIIENHLAPALDGLVADLRAAVGKCGDAELSDRAMLSAPRPVRDAWITLDAATAKYSLIRSVRGALVRVSAVDHNDVTDLFAEVHNAEVVWSDVGRDGVAPSLLTAEKAPWHAPDAKLRLVNMLGLGCRLWVPTAAQQELRWLEVFGARLEQVRQNRQRAAAVHGAFG